MNEPCSRCKKKSKDPLLKCSGMCKLSFHVKCLEMQSNDYETIQKCKGVKWFCTACSTITEQLYNLRSEIIELKKGLYSEIGTLRDAVNRTQATAAEVNFATDKSYAKAAREAVIIKPKSNKQDGKKTLEMIQNNVSPSALEVGISDVKTLKDGGVIIKCNTKQEITKVKQAAEKKLGKTHNVFTPDLRNPNIKILDIDREMKAEELLNIIKKQNICLDRDSLLLNVKVIKKMRNKWMAIIECDPDSFKCIMEANGLYIDWSRCRVFEYVNVHRCFKCNGFGHKADQCSNAPRCKHCADLLSDHEADKSCESDIRRCANCIEANNVLKTNFSVNHSVFDSNCPVLMKKIEIERQKIKYSLKDTE